MDPIIDAVRAELRPGGRPAATYLEHAAEKTLSTREAASLTTAILVNYEDRILEIEPRLGIG